MRYLMRQKLFCLGDDYLIKDDSGRDVFYVDGRALSIGDKLAFQDMSGRELAFIRQRLISLGPSYEIYRDGEMIAVVKKHLFTFFRCSFTVDVPGPNDLEAAGNLLDREYQFTRGPELVASVSKQWFTFSDSYGVDVAAKQDDVLILAATVVIDLVCHGDQKK